MTDFAVVGLFGVGVLHLAFVLFFPIGVGIAESAYDHWFFFIEVVAVGAGLSFLALGAHVARVRCSWPAVALVLPVVAVFVDSSRSMLIVMELVAIALLPMALLQRRAHRRHGPVDG